MKFLFRFTELPFLIHILKTKRLTLLSPNSWADLNDSYYIDLYRKKRHLQSVLALCFTETRETYHHWRVFSGNNAGVCITFYKNKLVSWAEGQGLRLAPVEYYNIKELRKKKPNIDDLPFIKRSAYRHEKEYRLIYEDKNEKRMAMDFEIQPNILIKRIRVNPWLPKPIFRSVKATIKNIKDCESLEIYRTTLVDNLEWKKVGESIV